MKKVKKKISPFSIVLTCIIIVSSTAIFLSIPVLFDYKSIEREIEKKFHSEFKIHLKILDEVSYKVLPQPHLLIKEAKIWLKNENYKSAVVKIEDLKIIIHPKNIYSKSNFQI